MNDTQRITLVTGATRGLGREVALQLGRAGHRVLVGARSRPDGEQVAEHIRRDGGQADVVSLDLREPASLEAAAREVAERFGRLDVLVNNAGVMLEGSWYANTSPTVSPRVLRDTFEVNFFGLVELTQRLLPLLEKSPAPNVVNLSSIMGSLSAHADWTGPLTGVKTLAYNASKTALNAFTLHLAEWFRHRNGIVNSAHPGWVKTQLGTEDAPMSLSEGARTILELATEMDRTKTGRFVHLGQPMPW